MTLAVGQNASVTRTISAQNVAAYAAISDDCPMPGYIPEPLIDALFSYLLGVKLPGTGTNYLKQQSQYRGRASIGDLLTATVVISAVRSEKFLIDLETTCFDSNGTLICEGRALVYVRDVVS